MRGVPSHCRKVGHHNTHDMDNHDASIVIKRVSIVNNNNSSFGIKKDFTYMPPSSITMFAT